MGGSSIINKATRRLSTFFKAKKPITSSSNRSGNIPDSDEPPPAYSETAHALSNASLPIPNESRDGSLSLAPAIKKSIVSLSGITVSTPEDPYAFLSAFDTIFAIDDSGSMFGRSWLEVEKVLRAITPICTAHDLDSIDLYFLNRKPSVSSDPSEGKAPGGFYGIKHVHTVKEIFTSVHPCGATPTGQRLKNILKPYLQLLDSKKHDMDSVRPINVIVITDGAPSDDVESTIVSTAQRLRDLDAPLNQIGIQFFQVGNESGAREALQELDDELVNKYGGNIRDMVDTVTWKNNKTGKLTADSILKVVLGAVVRRLDRRHTSGAGCR